jgi:hypothetical protein
MELFKYRNLALGCGFYLVFLLLSYYFNTVIRIAILALSGVAIITAILIYLISRRGLKALIRLIPIFSFVALSMIASLLSFDKNELFKYCDGNTEYNIECTVEAVDYSSDTMGIYTINVHRVEENQIDKRAKLYTFGKPLQRGSVVFLKGTLTKIESDTLGFDERGYNLSKGIEVAIDSEEYSVTGQESSLLTDIMLNVNSYLDGILGGRNSCLLEKDDVNFLYDEFSDEYKKGEFELYLHALVIQNGWYNKFTHGFMVYQRPTRK